MNKLTPAQKQAVKESILRGLEKQKFANWYNDGGDFDNYISGTWETGATCGPSKDDILGDIEDLLIPNL